MFDGCRSLISLEVPAVVEAGDYAFRECWSLVDVNLPLLKKSGYDLFEDCTALETINLPELETSGSGLCPGCSSLTEVNLPKLKTLGNYSFSDCIALESISLPLLSSYVDHIFSGCTNLKHIRLDSLSTCGQMFFYNLPAVESLYLPALTSTKCFSVALPTLKELHLGRVNPWFLGTRRMSGLQSLYVDNPTAPNTSAGYFWYQDANNGDSVYATGSEVPEGTSKVLYVPVGATGYDTGEWQSELVEKCGFTISYTL